MAGETCGGDNPWNESVRKIIIWILPKPFWSGLPACGAIIVKNDEIISTGYNGAPRGRANCVDMGYCSREAMNVPRGERYELCRSVHAEANAIISASRRDMVGGTIYLVGRNAATGELLPDATSCLMCRRMVINAGLERVVIRRTKTEFEVVPVETWIAEDDLMTPENVVMDLK